MRGSAVSQPWRLSRRFLYSFSIIVTGSWDPVSAATTAFCVIDETFDVAWLWSAFCAAMTAAGPSDQPHRQPVIAYALDAEPQITARSRQCRSRMPGKLCGVGS